MSVSLKQLTAMVEVTETLALQLRELIALRKIIAGQSVNDLIATSSTSVPRFRIKEIPKSASRRALRANVRALRPSALN